MIDDLRFTIYVLRSAGLWTCWRDRRIAWKRRRAGEGVRWRRGKSGGKSGGRRWGEGGSRSGCRRVSCRRGRRERGRIRRRRRRRSCQRAGWGVGRGQCIGLCLCNGRRERRPG